MAFGMFEVLAGDFQKGPHHQCVHGKLMMKNAGQFFREAIQLEEIAEIQKLAEGTGASFAGAVGLGLVGGLVLGPVGLAAGAIKGGVKSRVTFMCCLKDGRKFMATATAKVFDEISASHVYEKYCSSAHAPTETSSVSSPLDQDGANPLIERALRGSRTAEKVSIATETAALKQPAGISPPVFGRRKA